MHPPSVFPPADAARPVHARPLCGAGWPPCRCPSHKKSTQQTTCKWGAPHATDRGAGPAGTHVTRAAIVVARMSAPSAAKSLRPPRVAPTARC
ncbi:hypothetical protein ABB37_08818 [Leptomonas pyrrhocoris]|uniref:Uncharacterized protein n=1 Tax=Leptomonas pyrrhocoris TaxID=157538 RepID=A0A0M9FSU7_LEPPY|nr:hypothetical protein ABB37_08818 [Leptomonas pyrrhocoris]KPA75156.1 hypothetical protein ABB37_08818 [Leptomonas pyrrhocoris]|eukprot:XP_015653595.1 hypothetical protein ABB37_08818 [Leptomonas pyrrhocoris]